MKELAPTVYLVDDDAAVLSALTRLLTSAGLAPAAFDSPAAFLESVDAATTGCLVLDVSMPDVNGLDLQQALIAKGCALPIIFLTGLGDIPTSVRAMKHGAQDFLTKPVDDEELLAAIASALEQSRLSRNLQQDVAGIRERLATLTPREREVFERVVIGRLNKQIAGELGTVEKTIKVHRAQVMHKMGVRTFAELVRVAASAGLRIGEQKS